MRRCTALGTLAAIVALAVPAALPGSEASPAVTGLQVTPVTLSRLDLGWAAP